MSKNSINSVRLYLGIAWNHLQTRFGRKERRLLQNRDVILDGKSFDGAVLEYCRLYYAGGSLTMRNSRVSCCSYHFYGSAANTLQFMKTVFADMPESLEITFGVTLAKNLDEPTLPTQGDAK